MISCKTDESDDGEGLSPAAKARVTQSNIDAEAKSFRIKVPFLAHDVFICRYPLVDHLSRDAVASIQKTGAFTR
jgi:hypothetical protein